MAHMLPGFDTAELFRVKPRRKRCADCRTLQRPQLLIKGRCTSCLIQDPLPLFAKEVKSR